MHTLLLAVLLGLGVGAKDANHIVVKIDGTDRVVDLKANAVVGREEGHLAFARGFD